MNVGPCEGVSVSGLGYSGLISGFTLKRFRPRTKGFTWARIGIRGPWGWVALCVAVDCGGVVGAARDGGVDGLGSLGGVGCGSVGGLL